MSTPLVIPNFSMVGLSGERDNLERLLTTIGSLLPGSVLDVEIRHDDGCPCETGHGVWTACTCDEVDLTVTKVSP